MFIRAGIFILIYLGELVFWKNSFMLRVKSIPINVVGRRIIISFNISPYMTSQTFLATEKRALDPAEIEEFYSTISAWRPAACNIPL